MYSEKPEDLVKILGSMGEFADSISSGLPGAGSVAAKLVAMVLRAGAGFAAVGKDPLFEVETMLKARGGIERVHVDWQRLLDERFGRKKAPDSDDEATLPRGKGIPVRPPTDPYEY